MLFQSCDVHFSMEHKKMRFGGMLKVIIFNKDCWILRLHMRFELWQMGKIHYGKEHFGHSAIFLILCSI